MKKRGTVYKVFKTIGLVILACIVFIAFEIYISANWLSVNQFSLEASQFDEPVKLVILSDLHDHDFGESLPDKIREQQPDLILMAGDMINEDTEKVSQIYKLISELKEIAPVYYGLGNHEETFMEEHPSLIQELEESGCTVLDYKYEDLEIHGNAIRLGGLYDYPFGAGDCYADDASDEIKAFMKDFVSTDSFKIMIAHRPDSYVFGDSSQVYHIDLVVSGHIHGGQVVIPFKGGLYGGDQGWFPKYVHGLYEKGHIKMIVTSGLGTSKKKLPRFNNIPEIMVLTIGR